MKKGRIFFLLAVLFPAVSPVWSQFPNIQVSAPSSYNPEEVTIAINPTNPLNLAAGANINYYYYSLDGGATWEEGNLLSPLGVWGDPCVTFDADGNLYFGHLSRPNTYDGSFLDRIVIQKSLDGGQNWDTGAGVGLNGTKDQDKEWLIADCSGSQYHNNLYVCWTEFDSYNSWEPEDSSRIRFSRSTDSGNTWSNAKTISDRGGDCLDSDNTVEGAVPAVGPNGEVYVSWSGHNRIMFDRSQDGGKTFGKDILVSEQHGGWDIPSRSWGIYRCNGMPVTVCDISDSPYRGTIYILWSDDRYGDYDIFLSRSSNGGLNWSVPIKVNDDTSKRHQFFPWLCVDPLTGVLYAVFYDRRETSTDETDVYIAISRDGGDSFENIRVSESSFTPNNNVFFGDYINIAARGGFVYPIWTRMEGSDLSVWTAAIYDSTALQGISENDTPEEFRIHRNYPNPFNSSTVISFDLPTQSLVTLTVFDSRGRLVEEVFRGMKQAGTQEIEWQAGDRDSGVYHYLLQAGEKRAVGKCVLVR